MKSPEFSKFMNQATSSSAALHKHDIVLLSHDVVVSRAQMEMYGVADVFWTQGEINA